jgi:hypothetical protein
MLKLFFRSLPLARAWYTRVILGYVLSHSIEIREHVSWLFKFCVCLDFFNNCVSAKLVSIKMWADQRTRFSAAAYQPPRVLGSLRGWSNFVICVFSNISCYTVAPYFEFLLQYGANFVKFCAKTKNILSWITVLGLNPRSTHIVNYLRRDAKIKKNSLQKRNLPSKKTCAVRGSNVIKNMRSSLSNYAQYMSFVNKWTFPCYGLRFLGFSVSKCEKDALMCQLFWIKIICFSRNSSGWLLFLPPYDGMF